MRVRVGLIALLASGGVLANAHDGLLDPAALPKTLPLSERQQERIAGGRSVFFDIQVANRRYRAVAFRVNASADVVWRAINDFDAYANLIDGVERAEVYRQQGGRTFVEFDVAHWLIGRLNYSAQHAYAWPRHSWGTFALDEERASDFDAASGFWGTFTVAGYVETTDVVYAARLVPSGGLARWFRGRFVRGGLKSATQWLPLAVEE